MGIDRRAFAALGVGLLAAPAVVKGQGAGQDLVHAAMERFAQLTPDVGGLVAVRQGGAQWEVGQAAERPLFVGSVIKTFILAQTLREIEAGAVSEDAQQTIDDGARSLISPVFANLTGQAPLRSVLEAMITHSDNTATDVALAVCGVDKVRALIGEAGLTHTLIPDSTRRLISYIAGAPLGVDIGWKGMEGVGKNVMAGPPRSPMNGEETMTSSARDMVKWYQASMAGTYFAKPETLAEFKRIQAMGVFPPVTRPDIAAYGKGGNIDWADFHCGAFAGQMVFGQAKATLSFAINWRGDDAGWRAMFLAVNNAVSNVVTAVQRAVA